MRILIVEDEPLIASFIEKGLAAEGHAIEVAGDGPAGAAAFCAAPADLVVLDVMLPGFDGFEVLRRTPAIEPARGLRGLIDGAAPIGFRRRGCGEMADAPGLGPGGGDPVEVQVLSPASESPQRVIP